MRTLTLSIAVFTLLLGCQRKTTPAPKTCAEGQIKVGDNLCGANPLKDGLDTTRPPRTTPTPVTDPEPEAPGGGTAPTGETPNARNGVLPDPNISDSPYQPPAPTPAEIAASGGTSGGSIDSYKDLQVNVAIKALTAADNAKGPLGLYVKLSKPDLVSNIYVQYIKGDVIEGEKAFVPWDIFASIKFNAGAYLCEVKETRFDWETYRMKEPSLSKPVPYSCSRRSTN